MSDRSSRTVAEVSEPTESPLPVRPAAKSCCGLGPWAVGALLVIGVASVAFAAFFAGRATSATARVELPPIDATAAVTSEKFSMATGPVSGESEGLFVLDHNSGLLQCSVIYPRIGKFAATFSVNVSDALASGGKGGQYMMATGLADFPRASNNPVGQSVVYVLDSATGKFACYGIPFNRVLMNSGQPQSGTLRLLAVGTASPLIDRDSLR